MEENKDFVTENSAFEKVENAGKKTADKPQSDTREKKSTVKKSAVKNGKNEKKDKQTKKTPKEKREENAKAKLAAKEEKAKAKLAAKEAKAQRKAEKKKKAEKMKKAKAAAKKKKYESLKEMKIAKREERLAKKQALKNESKEEKQKRLAAEKQAKLKIKAEKANKKAELRKAKAERKAEMKRQKEENKHQREVKKAEMKERRGKDRRSRGVGGWLAAVISLGCSVLVLGSVLALSLFTDYIDFAKNKDVTANAERAYYDLVGYVDNMETNMSKLFVSSDAESQQRILGDLMVQSNLADSSLAALPITDESKYYTSKYINQVGDYAKYLNNRLIDEETLTNDDLDKLTELYNINVDLKTALTTLTSKINENYDFKLLKENNSSDLIISQFNEFEKGAVDYPEMIYDGAFSDGVNDKKVKGIDGEEVDEIQVEEKFKEIFADYEIEVANVTGMTENSNITCYNVDAMSKDGEIFAQFSRKGGKLVIFNAYRECKEVKLSEDECVEAAGQFLEKLGFDGMKCVWKYSSNGTEHLNFAYTENGVIMYPDLVKVNVCMETGKITGMDADNYYINHTERVLGKAKFTLGDAFDKVSEKLDVSEERVAVIPLGNGNETLAYEFIGTFNDSTYYVYLDADTLKEVEIYKVVITEEGTLLI